MSTNNIFWDDLNKKYSDGWTSLAKQALSEREMSFIIKYLTDCKPEVILDIGIGTGRILDGIVNNSNQSVKIYGLDFSEKMISICRDKYKNNNKIKDVMVCDISKEDINFRGVSKFDFITAIRVLKYNKNWKDILKKIKNILSKNGIFIFTMPNHNSINRFARYKVPYWRTTRKEITKVLNKTGYSIIEIRSFTKIPDYFYDVAANNKILVKLLICMEKLLELLLGKIFLGRILFVSATKK